MNLEMAQYYHPISCEDGISFAIIFLVLCLMHLDPWELHSIWAGPHPSRSSLA